MKVAKQREIGRHTHAIETLPEGGVLLFTASHNEAALQCFDSELKEVWCNTSKTTVARLARTSDGNVWVLEADGASRFDGKGHRIAHVSANVSPGMWLAHFLPFKDEFLFVCGQHHGIGPSIHRVSAEGRVRWTTTVPGMAISYRGIIQMRRDEGWRPQPKDPWIPKSWLPHSMVVSGDSVLVQFLGTRQRNRCWLLLLGR